MNKRHRVEEPSKEGATSIASFQLLDVPEVARLLSVGQTTVYSLIRSGQLPAIKIGKSRRIKAVTVQAFIERCQQAS